MGYDRLFSWNKHYGDMKDNKSLKELYDWLCLPESIFKMEISSSYERPALEGVVKDIEEKFENRPDFDLSNNRVRQVVGSVIKEILYDYGYRQSVKKTIPSSRSKYFKSATFYEKQNDLATKEIIQTLTIQDIPTK
jgi:hypothetical protein